MKKMKNLLVTLGIVLLIFGACLLSSCTVITKIPGYESLTGLDFRPYTEQGFLITPYEYGGEYSTISMINYEVMPSARLPQTTYSNAPSGIVTTRSGDWVIDELDVQIALDSIFEICINQGANALVDLEVTGISKGYMNIAKPVTIYGIRITGLAIERK
ncbi:hypothetical protein LCGC14_0277860 [marine sediment metagenome]|uniref:Uncharacterized protein n=1 Tax=marine sediment metagenome TaxID=412755 RepID=A0A0F9UDL4_9ZZZZ